MAGVAGDHDVTDGELHGIQEDLRGRLPDVHGDGLLPREREGGQIGLEAKIVAQGHDGTRQTMGIDHTKTSDAHGWLGEPTPTVPPNPAGCRVRRDAGSTRRGMTAALATRAGG